MLDPTPRFHRLRPWLLAPFLAVGLTLAMPTAAQTTPPSSEEPSGEKPSLRILFIGSSFTFYNDLPGMLSRLAAGAPEARTVVDAMVAHPGYSLDLHWRDEQQQNHLGRGPWDVVVLQEQAQSPLNKRQRMLDYATLLAEKAREQGAHPMLFMTWAPLRRPAMIEILAEAYDTVGEAINAPVAPVGLAWRRALEQRTNLRLHSADGAHPGPLGTYLAACVLYATLTGDDPRTFPDLELPEGTLETLGFLRTIAWETLEARGK